MSKPKSNSILDALPTNQQASLESWLFDENISYKDASARLLADFNVRCGPSSLGEWYQRKAQERSLARIQRNQEKKNAVLAKFKANPADTYNTLLEMVGQIAFEKAMDSDDQLDAETLFNFTKLVMHGRKQAMEAEQLALDKDKFQFDATKRCLAALEALRKVKADASLNETARIEAAMKIVFGERPAGL